MTTDTSKMTPRQLCVHNLKRIITAPANDPIEADDALRAIEDAIVQLQLGGSEDAVSGTMALAVAARDGKVIVNFGTKVEWLGMSPSQARSVANALLANAAAADQRSGGTNGEEGEGKQADVETLDHGEVIPHHGASGGGDVDGGPAAAVQEAAGQSER